MCNICTKPKALDTVRELVRGKKKIDRSLLYAMRRKSGIFIATEADKERGYSPVCYCGKKPINEHADNTPINVVKYKDGNVSYNGLMKCGNVWRCPVCNFKVSQHRKKEVYYLSSEWLRHSPTHRLSFITFTIRHKRGDQLTDLLDNILSEFRKYQRTKRYQSLKDQHGVLGFIKSVEITFSERNGWHPHLHILFFHKSNDYEAFHEGLLNNWLKRKNVDAKSIGQDAKAVYNREGITDYVTKWDVSAELTRSSMKSSKGATPFGILRLLSEDNYSSDSQRRLHYALFTTYCSATKGRHYIHISKDIKQYFKSKDENYTEQSDSEIIENEEIAQILFKIDQPLWRQLTQHHVEADTLNIYEKHGIPTLINYLIKRLDIPIHYDHYRKLLLNPTNTGNYDYKNS